MTTSKQKSFYLTDVLSEGYSEISELFFKRNNINDQIVVHLVKELSIKDDQLKLLESEIDAWREQSNKKARQLQQCQKDKNDKNDKNGERLKSLRQMYDQLYLAFEEQCDKQRRLLKYIDNNNDILCTRCFSCGVPTIKDHCALCVDRLSGCSERIMVQYVNEKWLKEKQDFSRFGYDFGQMTTFPFVRCNPKITIRELCGMIKKRLVIKDDDKTNIRLWMFMKRKNGTTRPMDPYHENSTVILDEFEQPIRFFVEEYDKNHDPYDPKNDVLIFIKHWNDKTKKLQYHGHTFENKDTIIKFYFPFEGVFEEVSPKRIDKLNTDNSYDEEEIISGDIIVVDKRPYLLDDVPIHYHNHSLEPPQKNVFHWFCANNLGSKEWSGVFMIENMSWRLNYFPKYYDNIWSGIYLHPWETDASFRDLKSVTVSFKITLVHPTEPETQSIEKQCKSHTFIVHNCSDWGFNKFCKMDILQKKYVDNNDLIHWKIKIDSVVLNYH